MAPPNRSAWLAVGAFTVAGYLASPSAFSASRRTLVPTAGCGPVGLARHTPHTDGRLCDSPSAGHSALAAGRPHLARRPAAVARQARLLRVEVENEVPMRLRSGSVEQMDRFMAEHAAEVCIQNMQRLVDKPDEPGVKECYLEPTDVGPFRSQMRLTVRVDLPAPGKCEIAILNMENGLVDKWTGKATFSDEINSNFKFDTSNTITWTEPRSGGLHLANRCVIKSENTFPDWFPVPDSVLQSLLGAFAKQIVSSGQQMVMDQMRTRFGTWQSKQGA